MEPAIIKPEPDITSKLLIKEFFNDEVNKPEYKTRAIRHTINKYYAFKSIK